MTAEEKIRKFRETHLDYWPDEVPLIGTLFAGPGEKTGIVDAERSWIELKKFWEYHRDAAMHALNLKKLIEATEILDVIIDIDFEPVIGDLGYNLMYLQYIHDGGPVPHFDPEKEANMTWKQKWEKMNTIWRDKFENELQNFGDTETSRNALNLMCDIEGRFATEGPF